jgi:hypothetical protein
MCHAKKNLSHDFIFYRNILFTSAIRKGKAEESRGQIREEENEERRIFTHLLLYLCELLRE